MNLVSKSCVLIFALMTPIVFAQNQQTDQATQNALEQTQQMLNNPAFRDKAVKENSETRKAHDSVNKLTGGNQNLNNQVYGLSSNIFGDLVRQAGGDEAKLLQLMQEAQKNPDAFANKLTPAQREEIRKLASEIAPPSPQPQAPR